MAVVKNQQNLKIDPELTRKMDNFEVELKKINEFLMNNNSKNPRIIKSVLKTEIPSDVKIINDIPTPEDEYEEVEVTDDEMSDNEN
jgi:predicted RND superfamily exporter protein